MTTRLLKVSPGPDVLKAPVTVKSPPTVKSAPVVTLPVNVLVVPTDKLFPA